MAKVTQAKRTTYKVNLNEFCKHAARLSLGGVRLDHPSAVMVVQKCVTAYKGIEKREITPQEAAQLINRGKK